MFIWFNHYVTSPLRWQYGVKEFVANGTTDRECYAATSALAGDLAAWTAFLGRRRGGWLK
jgi:hypothetical protein